MLSARSKRPPGIIIIKKKEKGKHTQTMGFQVDQTFVCIRDLLVAVGSRVDMKQTLR